jgi:hypothetical protein
MVGFAEIFTGYGMIPVAITDSNVAYGARITHYTPSFSEEPGPILWHRIRN